MEKFELVAEYSDCILISKKLEYGYKHIIRDNEGDVIKMVVTESKAVPSDFYRAAENYSLEEIRRIKRNDELLWRKEFVKA